MAFVRTVPPEESTGAVREIYDHDLKSLGYIANGTKAMSLRPDVFIAWNTLMKAVRSKMRLRRYELVTLAAASALHCTYCLLAHGSVLRKQVFDAGQLADIVADYHSAGLTDEEVAIMDFAEKVTLHAHAIRETDVENLRAIGLSDEEIVEIALAASIRNFIGRFDNALGTEPDEQ